MRDYVAMTTLVTTKLQSAGTADYTVAEVDYQIQECLKEYAHHQPHVVPAIFKIESRNGTASSTLADNLIDSTKGQFLSTDPTDEKVVHNLTDNNRAVITSFTSTARVGLSQDIFAANDQYRIYNKRCWNNKQIYLGNVAEYLAIDSVEYPIGTKRNWKILNDVLEIDVENVDDTDTTLDNLPDADVLVRFARAHVLTTLTDWVGKFAATAAAGATTISGSSLQAAGTINIGDEFYVETHRNPYVVTLASTIATTAAVTFYPGLETAVGSTALTFTFTKSSLMPNQEETFADLCAARLAINKSPKFFNAISLGGGEVWRNYQSWGNGRLGETLAKIKSQCKPKKSERFPTE